jgi:hypothetical protein
MPSKSATRASEFASEVKKVWLPYLTSWMLQYDSPDIIFGSWSCEESSKLNISCVPRPFSRPSIAILEGDPADIVLSWQAHENIRCPLVNMANMNKPGGDWETVTIGSEENLARRSNLVTCLQTAYGKHDVKESFHPIPPLGGIYSPSVGQ